MDGASPHQKIYCFYCPPGVPREILLFKTENVYAMGMRSVYVICDPAHLLKTAFVLSKTKAIFLNDQTWEGLQICVKSVEIIVWLSFHLSR